MTEPSVSLFEPIVGKDRVLSDATTLARYARSDTERAPSPAAVVRPRSEAELAQVVRMANEHGIHLYPVSRGENWGYGAACPVTTGQVLVDLRELNRIVQVDAELAFAVIEPGVTQGQLAKHLREHYPELVLDCTGAPASTSIVGNVLERGVAFQPGGRIANVAGMRVVLADGNIVQLGFGAYGAETLGHSRRSTLGPDLEGLFAQSNLGVVSRLAIWLRPRPEVTRTYSIVCTNQSDFLVLLQRFRALWMKEGFPSVARGGRPAPDLWQLSGVVYGSARYADAFRDSLEAACRGVARVLFIDAETDWEPRAAREVARVFGRAKRGPIASLLAPLRVAFGRKRILSSTPFEAMRNRVNVMAGRPSEVDVHMSIDEDDTSLDRKHAFPQVWFAPVCPLTSAHVTRCLEAIETVLARHDVHLYDEETQKVAGIEFIVTDPRSLILLVSLGFPRTNRAIEEQILGCYSDLWRTLHELGYVSYRTGIHGMQELRTGAEAYWDVVRRIKDALDPNGTLAPGRYAPHSTRAR
jgi:4-cresol dehydrogenase (hydroxylating) flavoprotein subunit